MTTVTREHLAGLELALNQLDITGADAFRLKQLIAQASAAPEQEAAAWIDPVALDSAGPVYDAGFRDGCAESKRLNAHPSAEIEQKLAEAQALLSDLKQKIEDSEIEWDRYSLAAGPVTNGSEMSLGMERSMEGHFIRYTDLLHERRMVRKAFLSATAQPAEVKS